MSILKPFNKILGPKNKIIGLSYNDSISADASFEPKLDLLPSTVETSGTTVTAWTSNSGIIDVGTLFGSPDVSPGGGIDLNGSSQFFTLDGDGSNFQEITENGIFSFDMRIRMDNIGSPQQTILQTKNTQRGIFVGTDGSTSLRFRTFTSANSVLWNHDIDLSTLGFTNGDDIEVVVVGDGSDSKIYIEGVLRDTKTVATEAGLHQFAGTLGRYTTIGSGYFNGAINAMYYEPAIRSVASIQSALAG